MRWLGPLLAAPLLLAACSAADPDPAPSPVAAQVPIGTAADAGEKPDLLLFTSLPIYWPEGGVGDLLSSGAEKHWARTALETRYALRPVDALTALPTQSGTLVMAQPRALSPAENVALDDFVRGGGRVLLIADPMLDVHSSYGLGDKRRPAAIAMLSPILARWGLKLVVDEREGYVANWNSRAFRVEEGGLFALTGGGHESRCDISGKGLFARCHVGKGEVMLLADATFLADTGHDAGENAGGDHLGRDHAGLGGEALLLDLVAAARTAP